MVTAQDDQVGVQAPVQQSGTIQGTIPNPASQSPTSPTQPISGGAKEAPISTPVTEWVSSSTPEIVLPQEVKDAGVESLPVVEKISEDAKQAGARMAHSSMDVPTVSVETLNIQTPRSVLQQLKQAHKKVSDSLSWLVRLIIKEQDKSNLV